MTSANAPSMLTASIQPRTRPSSPANFAPATDMASSSAPSAANKPAAFPIQFLSLASAQKWNFRVNPNSPKPRNLRSDPAIVA